MEEASALKLMLEESIDAWQIIQQEKKDELPEGEEVYREGIQNFRNILTKLPESIKTSEMRRELIPQEMCEFTKAEEEAFWIIMRDKLDRSPALRERIKQYLERP